MPATAAELASVECLAPEIPVADREKFIDVARPRVNAQTFGVLYLQALAEMAGHIFVRSHQSIGAYRMIQSSPIL